LILNWRQNMTSFLCLLYFSTLLLTPSSYKYVAILLSVISITMLSVSYGALKSRPAILITGSLLSYFLVTLVFSLSSGHYDQLDMPSRVLIAIIIFALLLQYPPSLKSVLYGCCIGASVVGLIALYQHYILNIRALSTGGFMPIQAAGMAASLSVFSIFAYIYGCQNRLKALKIIAFLGITLGFIATLLSGGRGSWVITPFVALWAITHYRKSFKFQDYMLILVSAILIVAMAVIPALSRAGLVLSELSHYHEITTTVPTSENATKLRDKVTKQPKMESNPKPDNTSLSQPADLKTNDSLTPQITSSSGIRVELWKTALYLFAEHPITGTGYQHLSKAKQELVEKGKVDPIVLNFSRAHNQLLEELQVKGLIGGLTLAILVLTPWFSTLNIQCKNRSDAKLAVVLLRCHLVLISGYMLTQHYINHHSGILFYSLPLIIFASIAIAKNKE